MSDQIRITYYRSAIGRNYRQKRIIKALGFKRLNNSRIVRADDSIMGMLRKVPHLVRIEALNEAAPVEDVSERIANESESQSEIPSVETADAQPESTADQGDATSESAEQNDAETVKDE